MVQESNIEWCTHTSNPLKYRDADGRVVWGCVKKSTGCANCYAETLALRYKRGGPFTKPAMSGLSPFLDEKELRELLSPKKLPSGSKCFVGDMTDVFGEWVPDEQLTLMFSVFACRPDVVFQVLTKRPERARAFLSDEGLQTSIEGFVAGQASDQGFEETLSRICSSEFWPLPNVWLGTSVEDQAVADERIPQLLDTPAAVRFLSCEPLLGPVDLTAVGTRRLKIDARNGNWAVPMNDGRSSARGIGWVIVGGESGPKARPTDIGHIRAVVQQCVTAGVPVFVKQLGSAPGYPRWDRETDTGGIDEALNVGRPLGWQFQSREGSTWRRDGNGARVAHYIALKDRKGGKPEEWPEDLRVREWPHA